MLVGALDELPVGATVDDSLEGVSVGTRDGVGVGKAVGSTVGATVVGAAV